MDMESGDTNTVHCEVLAGNVSYLSETHSTNCCACALELPAQEEEIKDSEECLQYEVTLQRFLEWLDEEDDLDDDSMYEPLPSTWCPPPTKSSDGDGHENAEEKA